jgi:plastocyanin/mono/diheme cytochrome c family protein
MLRVAPWAVLVTAAVVVSGCQFASSGDNLVNGKKLFIGEGRCGSCHTLARAGTKGTAGPDLDQAFQRALIDGYKRSALKGVVHGQIKDPNKFPQIDPVTGKTGAQMPAGLVTGQDASDVAAYVAAVAAKPGKDSGLLATVGGGGPQGTAQAQGGTLDMPTDPTGQLFYKFKEATAPAGQLTIDSKNASPVDHNIAIEGNGVDQKGPVVKDGATSTVKVDLKPGTYTFYCSVDGHRQAGMQGKLTVK